MLALRGGRYNDLWPSHCCRGGAFHSYSVTYMRSSAGAAKNAVLFNRVAFSLNIMQFHPTCFLVSHKGVRHGDPLSPILFNLVADCLTRMIRKAQKDGLITGLAENLIPYGVVILQYCNTRKFHHNKILLATWFSFIF
jgi:hypothetical protein